MKEHIERLRRAAVSANAALDKPTGQYDPANDPANEINELMRAVDAVLSAPDPLVEAIAEVERQHFRTQSDTGAAFQAMVVLNELRSMAGLPMVSVKDLPTYSTEEGRYVMPPDSRLLRNRPAQPASGTLTVDEAVRAILAAAKPVCSDHTPYMGPCSTCGGSSAKPAVRLPSAEGEVRDALEAVLRSKTPN